MGCAHMSNCRIPQRHLKSNTLGCHDITMEATNNHNRMGFLVPTHKSNNHASSHTKQQTPSKLLLCAHSCSCRQPAPFFFWPLSALSPIHLFLVMDDAQTHFGPMLCTRCGLKAQPKMHIT